ncbi:MAG: RNA polymerase sigma factor [Prevotella sp.]
MENLNLMTDEELAIMYVDGDNKAFDLLLRRNQEKLFTYILFVVRDREMANDMFQETFFKVVSRLQQGKYIANGKFSAWLMRIAHNVIMDWYRQQRAQNIVDAPKENDLSNVGSTLLESSREGELANNQVMEDVRRMMSHLPASQREVVFMRFYQQMSFKEIAEATGVSINTALGRMRYAILNLRRMTREHQLTLQMA